MSLRENYDEVERRICAACERAGRERREVTLIAVSKTKPAEMLREMAEFGQTEFGENHVQEICEKSELLPELNYHMIGHLQTNKVSKTVGRVVLIHSVDTLHLAQAISRESVKRGIVSDILIEINGGNEESKYGYDFSEAESAVREISLLPNIKIRGLMCVAPAVPDPGLNRPIFRKLKELAVDIDAKKIDNVDMRTLSMGMTNDFETAIEEGATMVRIGTALFGKRDYQGV